MSAKAERHAFTAHVKGDDWDAAMKIARQWPAFATLDNALALRRACGFGHKDAVAFFLDHGADIEAMDGAPLCNAAENGHLDIVELLLQRGADPSARHYSAAKRAQKKGHTEIGAKIVDAIRHRAELQQQGKTFEDEQREKAAAEQAAKDAEKQRREEALRHCEQDRLCKIRRRFGGRKPGLQ